MLALELIWRIYHRRSLVGIRKGVGDDRFNNAVVTFSYYWGLFFIVLMLVAIFY